jgi:hypothetical protein
VVFVTTRAEGTANLWILDVATHQARPLTSGRGGDFRPAQTRASLTSEDHRGQRVGAESVEAER